MHVKAYGAALAAALAFVSLAGCVSVQTRLGGDPALKVMPGGVLPPPKSAAYFIGPYDRLTVDVLNVESLTNREFQVDGTGRIHLPLVGTIEVAGRTPEQAAALVNHRLGYFQYTPQTAINIKETISRTVTVEGQVRRPGQYPVLGKMTLLSAIATAQGTDEYSKLSDVIIYRTVGEQRLAAIYDIDAIRHGNYADPEVYPDDLITVGDNVARRRFKDILSTVSLVSSPLIISLDRVF